MNKYFVYVSTVEGKHFTVECFAKNMKEAENLFTGKEILDDNGNKYTLEKIFSAKNKHVCKYCGTVTEGSDKNLLCDDCRDVFGHTFYSEL